MAVPQWTQNSGYKLATLQERVTSSITLPIAPGSASGTAFDPGTTSISLSPQSRIQNATNIGISKTFEIEPYLSSIMSRHSSTESSNLNIVKPNLMLK